MLTLYVQTHHAFHPCWNQQDPSSSTPLSRRVPGITCRDLAFANFPLNSSTTLFYTAEKPMKQEAPYSNNLLINLLGIVLSTMETNKFSWLRVHVDRTSNTWDNPWYAVSIAAQCNLSTRTTSILGLSWHHPRHSQYPGGRLWLCLHCTEPFIQHDVRPAIALSTISDGELPLEILIYMFKWWRWLI